MVDRLFNSNSEWKYMLVGMWINFCFFVLIIVLFYRDSIRLEVDIG